MTPPAIPDAKSKHGVVGTPGEIGAQREVHARVELWHLPPTSPMSDRASDRFYLIVRDNHPVQFIRVRPDSNPILMMRGAVVTKETVLVPSGSRLEPA
ncbi:hypothetical protein AB0N05_16820 [Nocardia sp. NPDC051030]|uniref:hypothetical protein n=1 Tax=Nocardia sp. NPDC051030 TaxID=3155162 RepID=UPI0034329309